MVNRKIVFGAVGISAVLAFGALVASEEQALLRNLAGPLLPSSMLSDPDYTLTPTLAEYTDNLLLTPYGKELLVEAQPEILTDPSFDEACSGVSVEPGVGVLGCYYTGRDKIFIYDVTDSRLAGVEEVVLAHELLHAAWERMDQGQQEDIYQELLSSFLDLPDGHPVVVRLMPYLESDPESLPTELHSIMGTEAVELPDSLETHYAQYFRDRPNVAADANDAYGIIDDTRVELRTLAKQLIVGSEELDAARSALERREINLEISITEFNKKADQSGFASKSEYERVRSLLEKEQADLAEDYSAFNEAVEKYNADVTRLESLNTTMNELNEGINIPSRQ